jgi:hypothetical protein
MSLMACKVWCMGAVGWEAVPTQVILASGDPIATDVVALGLIKAFGRWDLVTTKGVGSKPRFGEPWRWGWGSRPQEVELVADDLTGHSRVCGAGWQHQTACGPQIGTN